MYPAPVPQAMSLCTGWRTLLSTRLGKLQDPSHPVRPRSRQRVAARRAELRTPKLLLYHRTRPHTRDNRQRCASTEAATMHLVVFSRNPLLLSVCEFHKKRVTPFTHHLFPSCLAQKLFPKCSQHDPDVVYQLPLDAVWDRF